jgi:hypothetical protein
MADAALIAGGRQLVALSLSTAAVIFSGAIIL